MSTHTPKSADDQEIDLGSISRGIGKAVDSVGRLVFTSIRFFVRNIIIVGILIVLGVTIGIFLDQGKSYDHQVIVSPNFGSTDYLYSKIQLLDAKINERDTAFLKKIGIQHPRNLLAIKIDPVVDVYRFVNSNELNFRTLELLADDGDLNKIVKDNTTSKNYSYHLISLTSRGKISSDNMIGPIMDYLNTNSFYSVIQKTYIENIASKIKTNEMLISQIDAILQSIPESTRGSSSGATIINSQTSQLNDVIRTKDELIEEQGKFRIELVSLDKIIKLNSQVLNMMRKDGLSGKWKFVLPVIFIFGFVIAINLIKFYKRQALKYSE